MIGGNKISSRAAKDLLLLTIQEKKDPEAIATERGLLISSSSAALDTVVADILAQNESVVADYKKGKEAALQFLIGQGMKVMKGAVDPTRLKEMIQRKIN